MIERDCAVDAVVPEIFNFARRPSVSFGKKHLGKAVGLLHAHAAIADRTVEVWKTLRRSTVVSCM